MSFFNTLNCYSITLLLVYAETFNKVSLKSNKKINDVQTRQAVNFISLARVYWKIYSIGIQLSDKQLETAVTYFKSGEKCKTVSWYNQEMV